MESKIFLSNRCVFCFLPDVCQLSSRKRANIGCLNVKISFHQTVEKTMLARVNIFADIAKNAKKVKQAKKIKETKKNQKHPNTEKKNENP